jgi:NAD(P)-dependent dehydrogenase (short-subunit alcohol dehydrogenase family)
MGTAELAGRTALVTGGGRGIGRAIAIALAQASAHVAVLARSLGELDETVQLITAAGGHARDYG